MQFGLKGRHVAILAADGVDDAQVNEPRQALADAGMVADVLASRGGEVRTGSGGALGVSRTFDLCHAADYDALVIPGGERGVETLLGEQRALQFVREFMAADKPVAAIAEGVRLLIAADAVAGRAIVAANPELADQLRRAGAKVVEAPLHVDEKLITAQGGALADLTPALVQEFANRVDEARVDELSQQSFPASDPPPGPVAVGGEGASTALHLDPEGPSRGRASGQPDARP